MQLSAAEAPAEQAHIAGVRLTDIQAGYGVPLAVEGAPVGAIAIAHLAADGRPLAVAQIDVRGQNRMDIVGSAAVDLFGQPRQLRAGADAIGFILCALALRLRFCLAVPHIGVAGRGQISGQLLPGSGVEGIHLLHSPLPQRLQPGIVRDLIQRRLGRGVQRRRALIQQGSNSCLPLFGQGGQVSRLLR